MKPPPIISWKAIAESEIWQTQIIPWLEDMYGDTLEDLRAKSQVDSFHYWQGYATAIRSIMDIPGDMVVAEREAAARENKDDGERDATRRDWLRSIRTAIGR